MPDQRPASASMGDIIGSARRRLEEPDVDPALRLKSLVSATAHDLPPAHQNERRAVAPTTLPGNYFPQVVPDTAVTPKRKPQRGPARSLHISMRLSPPERDRLVQWCDARNLSLPDGILALLKLAEMQG